MSLVARCDSCRKAFKLDDKFAGKKVRCKACGGVITVPHAKDAPAAATAPRTGDLFNDLDGLLAMEESAAPVETAAPVRRSARRAAAVAPVATASANDGLAPAAYAQRKARRLDGEPITAPAYTPPNDSPYITFPADTLIERLIYFCSFGGFALAIVAPVVLLFIRASRLPDGVKLDWSAVGHNMLVWLVLVLVFAVVIFGLYAGLARLGVFAASKLMKFRAPDGAYLRGAAAVCAPVTAQFVMFAIWFGDDARLEPPMILHWALALALLVGVLWLMFRLTLAPFAATAGLVVLFAALLPWGIFWAILLATDLRVDFSYGSVRLRPSEEVRRHEEMMRPPEEQKKAAEAAARKSTAIARPPVNTTRPPVDAPPAPVAGQASGQQGIDFAAHHAKVEVSFKKIAAALKTYSDAHEGEYPVSLQQLHAQGLIDANDLRSPMGPYLYESGSRLKAPLPANLPLVIEVGVKDKRRSILWGDGRVETVEREDYRELLLEARKIRETLVR